MEPNIEAALKEAAERAQILDPDLITLPDFAKIVAGATPENANAAVLEMMKRKPGFFRSWNELSEEDFQKREDGLRESTRKSPQVSPGSMMEFRRLDAAQLDTYELRALEGALARGFPNVEERGRLTTALARQLNEQKTVKQGGA